MIETPISRRKFLKDTLAATAALAIGPSLAAAEKSESAFDAKGLPTRMLGGTGIKVPLIGVGTGSRFCAVKDEDKALQMLTYALEHGLYYWDTAHSYGNDEVIAKNASAKSSNIVAVKSFSPQRLKAVSQTRQSAILKKA